MPCRWHQNNTEDDLPSPALSGKDSGAGLGSRAELGRVRRAGGGAWTRRGKCSLGWVACTKRTVYTHSKTRVLRPISSVEDVHVISSPIYTLLRMERDTVKTSRTTGVNFLVPDRLECMLTDTLVIFSPVSTFLFLLFPHYKHLTFCPKHPCLRRWPGNGGHHPCSFRGLVTRSKDCI